MIGNVSKHWAGLRLWLARIYIVLTPQYALCYLFSLCKKISKIFIVSTSQQTLLPPEKYILSMTRILLMVRECCMGLPDQWISCHTIQLKILFPVFSMGLTLDTESAARSDSMRKYEKKNNEKWQVAAAWVASPLLSEIWSCLFVKWLN